MNAKNNRFLILNARLDKFHAKHPILFNVVAAILALIGGLLLMAITAHGEERPKPPATRHLFNAAIHDKPVLILSTAQVSLATWDGFTTRSFVRRGYEEGDPLVKWAIGTRPTWKRMAPMGAAQSIGLMLIAERMRQSHHKWVRRLWWVPQSIQISGNIFGVQSNTHLLRRK